METLEKLKEIASGISDENILAVDDKGLVFTLQDALKKGIKVSLTSNKQKSIEEFKKAFNIDLGDSKQRNLLSKILKELDDEKFQSTGKTSGGAGIRSTYGDEDKVRLIKEWQSKNKKTGLTKTDFSKANNIHYATFNSWFKKEDIMNKVQEG